MSVFHPNVISLESMTLDDNVPRVQPTPASIDYEVAPQSNLLQYVDHAGYKTELGAEVEAIGQLERVLEEGRNHVNVLYGFRSVSRAIPMVSGSNDPNKNVLHMNTFKILRPEMEKLRDIMLFHESAVQVFCTHVETLAKRGKKQVVPEGLYDALIAVIDLLQKMDYLKDTKACLTNDFSRYKRALTSVRQELPDADALGQEQHSLQLFLGNPKYPKQLIINTLRDGVKAIPGHLEVLVKMLQLAVERLETNRYMTPDEKYRNVRVVPHLLWLLDGDTGASNPEASFNVFKQRKFKLQSLQRICQRYPVVPQCGDVAIRLSYVLERCPHFDPDSSSAWFADATAAQDYNVLAKWGRMTGDFDEYATRLSNALNEIGPGPFVKTAANVRIAAKVSKLVLHGLCLLQRWSCVVLECVAWKHTHPCSQADFVKQGGNPKGKGMEYEKVVRYNWTSKELSALVEPGPAKTRRAPSRLCRGGPPMGLASVGDEAVEFATHCVGLGNQVITMTKSLGSLLSRAEGRLAPLLRLHVHASTQQMAQGDLVPVLHRAFKKKRDIVKQLLQLRSMVSDWSEGGPPSDDYKKYKRAQGRVEAKSAPRRVVGPSATQLQLVRAMVRAIYDENSELRQSTGILGREDLNRDDLGLLRAYYEESFGFPYLLDLGGTIRCTTDLGDLWYREYHLELTKEIQFPIEMSFPWILTEHIVKTKRAMSLHSSDSGANPNSTANGAGPGADGHHRSVSTSSDPGAAKGGEADEPLTSYGKKSKKKKKGGAAGGMGHVLVEEMLWALDLYNDAAHRALYVLNSQYLFNEIQAEVNLVFNQLLFDLEAEVFGYFKDWAASTTLDKMFKRIIEARRGWGHYFPGRRRYETPVQQRHVQLLGRSVDLTRRVSVAMNLKISEDLELALRRFESGGLSGIVELEGAIETAKQTHTLIQQAGLGVDPFLSLWGEANEVVGPAGSMGRVVAHVVRTLVLDLFANYRFCSSTRRLVKSPVEIKPMKYPSVPNTMDKNLGGGRMCTKAFDQLYSVGRRFVGAMHLESMVRVLGYADLPLVIETIIEHMQQKLLDIKDWTDALKGGLPPVKLPKYVFGTAGCYSFIEEKLRPILEYEDLKTGVFQDFREFGNALGFLQCLSEVTAGHDCLKFVHTVPVMGLSSSKKWDPKRTRLVAATTALTRSSDVPGAAGASLAGLEEVVLEGQDLCKGLATSASLFRHTLAELDAALDRLHLRDSWAGESPSNGVMDVEESSAFSRLFSALNFLFCMPEAAGAARVTDAVQFGDGFGLAGSVIVHLLGQRQQFELLDFSYHVLNVNNFERAGSKDGVTGLNVESAKKHETEAFIFEAHRAYCLIYDAFSVAEAVLPSRASGASAEVRIFHPPADDTKINRALLADGGMWETKDKDGDRKAAEAAKRVQLQLGVKKPVQQKSVSGLGILRKSKDRNYGPSEEERQDQEDAKKKLSNFTFALADFIGGPEEGMPPPDLPAPISQDLLADAGMKSPTSVATPILFPSSSPPQSLGAGAAASRAKPPASAPPPPGTESSTTTASKPVPGRPPPPSGPPQPPGMGAMRPPNPGKPVPLRTSSAGSVGSARDVSQLRGKSMSPTPSRSFPTMNDLAIGSAPSNRMARSSSVDSSMGGSGSKGALPRGAEVIMEMGFSEHKARVALQRADGDVDQAVEWLLANGSAPELISPKEDFRPPSPSTGPAPQRKSMKKKPGVSQNPIFDGEAFTPVLIPAKKATQPTGAPPAWVNPPSVGAAVGGSSSLNAPISANPLALVPVQVGSGPGPGLGAGQAPPLARPRSTPDVISALDPDVVDSFEPEKSQPPQPSQWANGQGSPPPAGVGISAAGAPAGGLQFRRQSAPSGLSPSKLVSGMPAMPQRGQQNVNNQGAQPSIQVQQHQQPLQQAMPNMAPQPRPQQQAMPNMVPQQQPQRPGSTVDSAAPRRPPPPSGPAAVGGSTARGFAQTPVPRKAAPVGGSMPRTSGVSISPATQGLMPVGAGGSTQARPHFQTTQSMPQQQLQQQVRSMQQGVGMGAMVLQANPKPRGPMQVNMGQGGTTQQLTPMSGNVQQLGGVMQFARPQQQQQQFAQKSQGQGGMMAPQGGMSAMNPGQQVVRSMVSGLGTPQLAAQQQQARPQLLQPVQQQQQPRPQQLNQQQQPRPMQGVQVRPLQQLQPQQQVRPQIQQQQARTQMPQLQPVRPQQMQQQIRPQMPPQGRPQMQQFASQQQLPRGQQLSQQVRPMQQQTQGVSLQTIARGPRGIMARPQQGMQQPNMRQGMVQSQGVMGQNNTRPMMAMGGASGGVRPQQMNQQQQPRPFGGAGTGYSANQMQMQQQMQQGPRGNMSGGQFGQAGGAMTPQQQQQQQQQRMRQQQQHHQQQQQNFNPRG